MASTYLQRTNSSGGNRRTFTFSCWIKRSALSSSNDFGLIEGANDTTGNYVDRLEIENDSLAWVSYHNASDARLITSRLLRDVSAWYHIVLAVDTTQATASNRIKLYINGEQETSFSTETYMSQNYDTYFNVNSKFHRIGGRIDNVEYFDGLMAHVHFIDGTAYDADTFGETDSTSGIWKPKVSPSVTYGTNGFFLKFQDSSSLGDDSSGNTNDFTLSGSGIQILDTPSNVFATLNPLDKGYTGTMNTSDGNTTMDSASGSGDYGMRSTLAVNSGKWYWETKLPNYGGGNGGNTMMVMDASIRLQINMQGGSPRAGSWGIQRYSDSSTNLFEDGTFISQNTAMWGGLTTSDIIGIALDCDNGKIYFSKNGVFKDRNGNTGDPANGTNPTFTGLDTSEYYTFYTENRANLDNGITVNFGNGYFQTTAVTSAQNDDAGYGKFEYSPPTGFYALCTKNINTYG